jgi:hypothetical protein
MRQSMQFALRAGLGAAALLVLGGCPTGLQKDAPNLAEVAADALDSGSVELRLRPNEVGVVEIRVPAGQGLEVLGGSGAGNLVQVQQVLAPDGQTYPGAFDARSKERDAIFGVEKRRDGDSDGFRMATIGDGGGLWRIGIVGRRTAELAALAQMPDGRDPLMNLLFLAFLMNGARADDPLAPVINFLYPGAAAAFYEPMTIYLEVTVGQVAPPALPDEGGDGSSGGDNSGGDNSGGDGSGGDSSGGDDSGGDNGGTGGDNNGGGTGGDDPPPPPTTPPPTVVHYSTIVETGDAVPGQAETARFTYFTNPVIDSDGRLAFWAKYSGGQGDGGLFVYQNGQVESVLTDSPSATGSVPGRTPTSTFGNINILWDAGAPSTTWGSNGRLLFTAPYEGAPYPIGAYRWRATDGDMVRVADMQQMNALYTAALPNTFSQEIFNPYVSDGGVGVFTTRYSYIMRDEDGAAAFVTGKTGIFLSNGTSVSIIADPILSPAGVVPDQPNTAAWDVIENRTSMNPAGEILFQAKYRRGNGSRGIYLRSGGQIVRVLDNAPNRSFPGLQSGAVVGASNGAAYEALALGPAGHIAVDTQITINGATRDTVLFWNGSQWREQTSNTNVPASALLTGVNRAGQVIYLADGRPYLGGTGTKRDLSASLPSQLVGVNLRWETSGAALNDNGRAVLRYTRLDANNAPTTSGLVLWTGERMLIVFDAAADLPGPSFNELFTLTRPESNRVSRSGFMNERDQVALRLGSLGADGQPNTADDRQAILIARGGQPDAPDE